MEINRKIYYNKSSGLIIWDKGEMSGDVIETTLEEDLITFPLLQSIEPTDLGIFYIPYGWRSEIPVGSMKIIDTELIIYPLLSIQADKLQINSDGVTTTTITSDYAECFSVNDGEDYYINPFKFSSEIKGTYMITAKSTTNGQKSIEIEVV